MATPSSLPYHEPTLVALLVSSTFLLALNGINSALDRTLACGLVGQVLIGTAWGVPGAGWLSLDFQRVVSDLGYLGLILVVYAGGLETDVGALRKNLVLSVAVAVTGVAVPIALSFALLVSAGPFLGMSGGASSLQAFAAGAALCSTSLGTTFSVLQASGLSRTRLGAVLASAAMLDDVVGLIMVRIITGLGKKGTSGIEPATILRPVLVSLAFAVIVPVVCHHVPKPGKRGLDRVLQGGSNNSQGNDNGKRTKKARLTTWIRSAEPAFMAQTALLILLIVAADYAGASILLAAYLAGVVVSWWDGDQTGPGAHLQSRHPAEQSTITERQTQVSNTGTQAESESSVPDPRESEERDDGSSSQTIDREPFETTHDAAEVFEKFYGQVVYRILKPFFFASIGFSVPISKLFVGDIVWRRIIYTILMVISRLVCGLWLVRFPISAQGVLQSMLLFVPSRYNYIASRVRVRSLGTTQKSAEIDKSRRNGNQSVQATPVELTNTARTSTTSLPPSHSSPPPQSPPGQVPSSSADSDPEPATPPKPLSLYPAAVIGCAMVARGEIGFLISSTAESEGVFHRPDEDASEASDLFLIITWAIVLCTVFGPVCTGLLVRRIKKLEKASEASRGGGRKVLGVWGWDKPRKPIQTLR